MNLKVDEYMYFDIRKIEKNLDRLDGICFTIDIDWASEYAIEKIISFFKVMEIPLTVFATHESCFLKNEIKRNGLEVGIHPNFISPSSQGNNAEEIITYCTSFLPKSLVFRCHRWYANNDIYDNLYKKGFRYESNLCSAFQLIPPFLHRSGMMSFPVFFEDGAYLYHDLDLDFSQTEYIFNKKGIKVIDLHPMHFVLNTPYFQFMRKIKNQLSRAEWSSLDEKRIDCLRNRGIGIADYIKNLVAYVHRKKIRTFTLQELYNHITI